MAGDKVVSMNLKDSIKPTYGVIAINGEEVNKGPDFMARKIDGKMSRKEYLDKFESMKQRGVSPKAKHQEIDIKKLFNAQTSAEI